MTPDLTKILIVVAFLGALILARQIILVKSGAIKNKFGVQAKKMVLIDSYKLEKSSQLSLFEIAGQNVVVLHGKGGQAGLLLLNQHADAVASLPAKDVEHD